MQESSIHFPIWISSKEIAQPYIQIGEPLVAQHFFRFLLLAWASYYDSGRQKGRMWYVIVNLIHSYSHVSHLSFSNVYQGTIGPALLLHVAAIC